MFGPRLVAVLALALAGSAAARAAELDPYLPGDTQSYVSVNLRQVIDSPLFKKQLLGPARDALKDAGGEVQDVLKDLGIDPFKHVDRVIVSTPGGTETDRGLVIVHGTFDQAKFKARAEDAARDKPDILKIHKVPLGDGASHPLYEVVVPNQDLSLFVALASEKTLLVSPGKDYVVDGLKNSRAKKKPVLKSKPFQALLEGLDSKQSLSIAVQGKSLANVRSDILPKAINEALADIEAIGGGLTISNELKLDVLVAGKDERSAKVIRDALDKGLKVALVGLAFLGEEKKELTLLLEIVKSVKVSQRGKVMSVSGRLTQDVLEDFFKKDG